MLSGIEPTEGEAPGTELIDAVDASDAWRVGLTPPGARASARGAGIADADASEDWRDGLLGNTGFTESCVVKTRAH